MKNSIGAIVIFFLLLFTYTKLAGPIPFSLQSIVTNKTDAFTVSGEGKITLIPDIAVLSVGVSAEGISVSQVQDELNGNINAISAAMKKRGIDTKDIKTSYYNITPTYDYENSRQKITGYQANSNLTIKVRKIDSANDVIDAATQAGANQVGDIFFDVDDKTKAENEARELAVLDAKSKAKAAARAAGFSLGRVINYSEDGGNGPRPIMYDALKLVPDAEIGQPTQVEPGTSEISIIVTLSYEIR